MLISIDQEIIATIFAASIFSIGILSIIVITSHKANKANKEYEVRKNFKNTILNYA